MDRDSIQSRRDYVASRLECRQVGGRGSRNASPQQTSIVFLDLDGLYQSIPSQGQPMLRRRSFAYFGKANTGTGFIACRHFGIIHGTVLVRV